MTSFAPSRRGLRGAALGVGVALALAAAPARAYTFNDQIEVYGYFQTWWTVYEQMQEADGLFQDYTDDPAANWTSGFRLNRLRLGLNAKFLDGKLEAVLLLRLEGDPGMMDIYARWRPLRWLSVLVGQFRIPSTAENLTPDRDLPFILRTKLSDILADFSLSRTNFRSLLFYGNRSFRRDFGIGLRVNQVWRHFGVHLQLMVGNGLGANLFISGDRNRGFLITNRGQFFYAGRVALDLVPGWLTLGGHLSWNKHDNVVFNSGRTVLDLNRWSTSADLVLHIAAWGVTLGGLGGHGRVLEDGDHDGRKDYVYEGVAGYVLWDLQPLLNRLTHGRFGTRHHVELGARFEWFADEANEAGEKTHVYNTTLGVTYRLDQNIKIQFNAMLRRIDEPAPVVPDLDDDAYILSAQFAL